jgi:hypothetical protein
MNSLSAQPSSSTRLLLRIIDKKNNIIDERKFCSDFKRINEAGQVMTCDSPNYGASFTYDTLTKSFCFKLGVITGPYIFSLQHEMDTMTFYIPWNDFQYFIDSVKILNGMFRIDGTYARDSTLFFFLQ